MLTSIKFEGGDLTLNTFSLLIAGCILLIFCACSPTQFDTNTSPDHLIEDLMKAYEQRDLERYLGTFTETCTFGLAHKQLWDKDQEGKIHRRMFSQAREIELKIRALTMEAVSPTLKIGVYDYHLRLALQDHEMVQAEGQVALEFAQDGGGQWFINTFRELRSGLPRIADGTLRSQSTQDSVDYFPLTVGNHWTYEEQFAPNVPDVEVEVVDSLIIKGNLYYTLHDSGFPFFSNIVRVDSLSQLRMFFTADSSERVVFDFGASVGDSVIFVPPGATDIMVVELISEQDSLRVPAGIFKDVLEFHICDFNSGSVWSYEFAADVGMIRQQGTNQELALKSALVNGTKYPIITGIPRKYLSWAQIKKRFIR